MALSGWGKKCQITVAANKITSAGTNQVLYFSAAHFNSGMLTLGGADACKTDGSDLRFSSDADGDNLLGFHVVKISLSATPASSILVVAVRFPTITANASFSFYCHWGNAAAETPAISSVSGSGTCWSEFYGVLPLNEDPALFTTTQQKWKCFKDVTGRYSAGSMVGAPTASTNLPIAGMPALQVSTLGGVQIPEVAGTTKGGFQFAMLAYVDALTTGTIFTESNTAASQGYSLNSSGIFVAQYSGDYSNNFTDQIGKWVLIRATLTGTTLTFKMGTKTATIASAPNFANLQFISSGSVGIPMKVCSFMINQFANVPDTYFTNLLDCVTNNATLASAGSIQSASVSASLVFSGFISGSDIVIRDAGTNTIIANTDANITSSWTYNYTVVKTVDILVCKSGYEPLSIKGYVLSGTSGVPILITQKVDRNYV